MIVEQGEKLHIITRRAFEDDLRRHFIGEVMEAEGSLVRVEGFAFILDTATNSYLRRPERRTRIICLADANNLVNVLPDHIDLDATRYEVLDGRLVVTDGTNFKLDVNEFGKNQ